MTKLLCACAGSSHHSRILVKSWRCRIICSDHDWSCRVESGEAAGARAWAEGYQRLFPGEGVAWLEVASGCAVFAGPDSPVTQVQGAGMRRPVSEEQFNAIEDLYFSRNSRAQVVVCPLAHPSLLAGLSKREYTVSEMENILAMQLDAESVASAPASKVAVRPVEQGESREWAETVARGLVEEPEFVPAGSDLKPDETLIRLLMGGEGAEGYFNFASCLGGRMIGDGSVFIQGGVAMLNGASTIAAFRRRGSAFGAPFCATRPRLERRLQSGACCNPAGFDFPAQRRTPRISSDLHAGGAGAESTRHWQGNRNLS